MNEECLICKAPLMYLGAAETMECSLCGKKRHSRTRCINGHFVCDECHTKGMDTVMTACLGSDSADPIEVMEQLMALPSCHMHGPEHHVMVGSALLTAYKNAGGEIDLGAALLEMHQRGRQVPGGACGYWGACGAGVSTGMFISIALGATPLATKAWGLSNRMTARALDAIGKNGGPRCCKRDSYLAITEAVKFTEENLGIRMKSRSIHCSRSHLNNQCLHGDCPFFAPKKKKVAFICVHNSCRSQIAEALGKHLAADVFESYSAGTETKTGINPDAVRLMKQLYGIDMEKTQHPKLISAIPDPDVAVSMGCNVGCPFIGRGFDDDWGLEDPTGKPDKEFIKIIKEIEKKVLQLRDSLR